MNHYAHMLTLTRLRLPVHLGFYDRERELTQPVEICLRLYFHTPAVYATDDEAHFIDYAGLSQIISDFASSRKFRLLEYFSNALFAHMRATLDARDGKEIALWLKVNKVEAPVPNLQGGAAYILCDLPPGATAVSDWA